MKSADSQPSREEVLYAFAMELTSGRDILEQYLRDFPEYAAELIDLSYELSCEARQNEMPLSDEDQALIDKAWQRHVETAPTETIDPFVAVTAIEQRNLAQRLDVPRQVITAFRERRVELTSVPSLFLERLAAEMNSTVEILRTALALPPEPGLARSYKADRKPKAPTSVTFEQLLIEANVPPAKRALLMTDES